MNVAKQLETIILGSAFANPGGVLDAATIVEIEDEFEIDITIEDAAKVVTVADLTALVERKLTAKN